MRRTKKGVRNTGFTPYFNRSGKLGSFIAAREPDKSSGSFGLFYTGRTGESFKFCPVLNNQDFASHANGALSLTPHKFNICFTSCLHKPAKHIISPWGLRVLWRYVYVWAIDDTISSVICEKYSRSTFRIARYLGTYWVLADVASFALYNTSVTANERGTYPGTPQQFFGE